MIVLSLGTSHRDLAVFTSCVGLPEVQLRNEMLCNGCRSRKGGRRNHIVLMVCQRAPGMILRKLRILLLIISLLAS